MADFNASIIFLAKWLNLHSANNQYLSQAKKLAKDANLNAKMKKAGWDKLFVQDANGDYPTPDPEDQAQTEVFMEDSEWEKLYREFLKTFRGMDVERKSIKDVRGAEDYLNLVYGYGRTFAPQKIQQDTKDQIKNLTDFLRTSEGKTYGRQIARQLQIEDFDAFLTDVSAGKYETDGKIKKSIKDIIEYLQYYQQNDTLKLNDADASQKLNRIDFTIIENGFDPKREVIDPTKVNDFKSLYPELLRNLVLNKDLRESFETNGGGKITKPITKALEQTDYKNAESDYFVAPSEKDTLSPIQEIQKKLKDVEVNTIGKLKNAALRDKYLIPGVSKPIAVAAYDAGFHPKDGLAKFLELAPKIEAKFKGKNPKAAESFKFLVDVLKYAQTNTPKQFEGALKNGIQGLNLDILIAEHGIREGKSDEQISAAHEVLSKLRWGYNTSVMREKLAANSLTIFSDPNMSFNKGNEAMQFMSRAVDKTMHLGMMGVFNVTNLGVNAIRRQGRFYKLNNSENKRIAARDKEIDEKITAKGDIKANIQNSLNTLRGERTGYQAEVTRLNGYEENGPQRTAAQAQITAAEGRINGLKSNKQPFESRRSTAGNRKEQIERAKEELVQKSNQIEEQIAQVEMELTAAKSGGVKKNIKEKQSLLDQLNDKKNENDKKIAKTDRLISANDNISNNMDAQINNLDQQINNETVNNINPLQKNIDDYDTNKSQLDDIDKKISDQEAISKSLDDQMDKMENKDKKRFLNLMATRNMMNGQGGFTKNRNLASLFFEGQKKVQSRFDADKANLKQEYILKYWANQGVDIAV